MAGIALKDRVDLISIMVPLKVIAKNHKHQICIMIRLEDMGDFTILLSIRQESHTLLNPPFCILVSSVSSGLVRSWKAVCILDLWVLFYSGILIQRVGSPLFEHSIFLSLK